MIYIKSFREIISSKIILQQRHMFVLCLLIILVSCFRDSRTAIITVLNYLKSQMTKRISKLFLQNVSKSIWTKDKEAWVSFIFPPQKEIQEMMSSWLKTPWLFKSDNSTFPAAWDSEQLWAQVYRLLFRQLESGMKTSHMQNLIMIIWTYCNNMCTLNGKSCGHCGCHHCM